VNATEYWLSELTNRSEATKSKYESFLLKFAAFCGKSPDELLKQRKIDLRNEDVKVQRSVESNLKGFISSLAQKNYSISTQQIAYSSVRSFFEMSYLPLRMRRGDYPSGESLGSRAATKDDIRVLVEKAPLRVRSIIMFLKDTGLRVSDARRLLFKDLGEDWEKQTFIPLFLVTKKAKTIAKTFIGIEAINALKEYVEQRKKGTRKLPPETITPESPLFRTRSPKVKPLSRSGFSALIFFQAQRCGINKGFSAHSFRKYVQTNLEAAGVHPNWIDQMLGHKLINSRDSYSLPVDEQLREAYERAYAHLAVLELSDSERLKVLEKDLEEARTEISDLRGAKLERDGLRSRVASLENAINKMHEIDLKDGLLIEQLMENFNRLETLIRKREAAAGV